MLQRRRSRTSTTRNRQIVPVDKQEDEVFARAKHGTKAELEMQIAKHLLLPASIAFAVAVPIAVNHDEAYLDHARSPATKIGDFQREHMLGMMAIGALTGAAICAGALGRGTVAAVLGAGALGVTAGTVAGHAGWDQYLARVEGQSKPAA